MPTDDDWRKMWFEYLLNRLSYLDSHGHYINAAQFTLISITIALGVYGYTVYQNNDNDYVYFLILLLVFSIISFIALHIIDERNNKNRKLILNEIKYIFKTKDITYTEIITRWKAVKKKIH